MFPQNSDLIEKTIQLVTVENTGTQYKITDEKGDFYSFFINKKAGGLTQAAQELQNYKQGDSVNVVYEERAGSQGGTFRNVAKIKPAGGQVTTSQTQPDERFRFSPVPETINAPSANFPQGIPQGLPNTQFGLTPKSPLPRDLSITAQAFAKSLLESHQATPQDLVNPQWWATIIFPAIAAMVEGSNQSQDISVEDIPF